jgi:hypothetical protein
MEEVKHPLIKDVLIPNFDSLVEELKGRREKMKLSNIMHQHGHSIQKIVR